jgi:hypothetical protein
MADEKSTGARRAGKGTRPGNIEGFNGDNRHRRAFDALLEVRKRLETFKVTLVRERIAALRPFGETDTPGDVAKVLASACYVVGEALTAAEDALRYGSGPTGLSATLKTRVVRARNVMCGGRADTASGNAILRAHSLALQASWGHVPRRTVDEAVAFLKRELAALFGDAFRELPDDRVSASVDKCRRKGDRDGADVYDARDNACASLVADLVDAARKAPGHTRFTYPLPSKPTRATIQRAVLNALRDSERAARKRRM